VAGGNYSILVLLPGVGVLRCGEQDIEIELSVDYDTVVFHHLAMDGIAILRRWLY
jgi:hypothetical protein